MAHLIRPSSPAFTLGSGGLGQARPELATAVELYRAMDMTFWLPRAEAELAMAGG